MSREFASFRKITSEDSMVIFEWRNHPNVRRFMLTQHEISYAEHYRWLEGAMRDQERALFIFEEEGMPLGFVHFNGVKIGGIADWGFYTAPFAPKGTGKKLCRTALALGFKELGLHKICGQVLAYNLASVRIHQILGFQQEGLLSDQYYDGNEYHDLLCFGLLHNAWLKN